MFNSICIFYCAVILVYNFLLSKYTQTTLTIINILEINNLPNSVNSMGSLLIDVSQILIVPLLKVINLSVKD